MLSTALIVFREVFEICLILSVIFLATKNLTNRAKFIYFGLVSGLILSSLLAISLSYISKLFHGAGQEILNITLLTAAILMIIYTVAWMKKNSSNFNKKFADTAEQINKGQKTRIALSIITALTVLREGAEIILFLNGIYASGTTISQIINGSLVGIFAGLLCGILFYYGLIKIAFKYIFSITSWILIFVCAGMASKIPLYLSSANLLTIFSTPIWDSSWLITDSSTVGQLLNAFVGYESSPSLLQLVFYVSTMIITICYTNKISRSAS